MASSVALRLLGVWGRTLKKRSSIIVTVVLLSSVALLHTASQAQRPGSGGEYEGGESEDEDEDDSISPAMIVEILHRLQEGVSSVATWCRRMARLGGKVTCSCEKKECSLDGAKLLCLDDDVRPVPGDCFALNFGIGFELTFDEALVKYGCKVIALDPTNGNITNMLHNVSIATAVKGVKTSNSRTFHALNLGLDDKDNTLVLNVTFDSIHYSRNLASYFTYRSVLNILDNPRTDLLKIDIEGTEWRVLKQILTSPEAPRLLQHVRQILLEIHLDFLHGQTDVDSLIDGTRTTLGVLQRLRTFGFHLAAYELNENGQKYFSYGEVKIPLYRELTLIRRLPNRRTSRP
ncbi:uncharacterized protein [Panulirus ornatus]|uniref:uncharacterized protein n=1 Tax=Panulirus ornatus TaxID=150431 RepID=UPI003A84A552